MDLVYISKIKPQNLMIIHGEKNHKFHHLVMEEISRFCHFHEENNAYNPSIGDKNIPQNFSVDLLKTNREIRQWIVGKKISKFFGQSLYAGSTTFPHNDGFPRCLIFKNPRFLSNDTG